MVKKTDGSHLTKVISICLSEMETVKIVHVRKRKITDLQSKLSTPLWSEVGLQVSFVCLFFLCWHLPASLSATEKAWAAGPAAE